MNPAGLFGNVAENDALAFGSGANFDAKRVVDWMNLNKEEVSRIASVAKSTVRYDEKAPQAVVERLEEIANVINMVAGVFNGDPAKTALWFKMKNPMLGDVSPRDMVRLGRYDRLRRYVVGALQERNQ